MQEQDQIRYLQLQRLATMWEQRDRNEEHAAIILNMDRAVMDHGWDWWIIHNFHEYVELKTALGYIARKVTVHEADTVDVVTNLVNSVCAVKDDVLVDGLDPITIKCERPQAAEVLRKRKSWYAMIRKDFLDIAQSALM